MNPTDFHATRAEVLNHFLKGDALSESARDHHVSCVACIADVTTRLTQEAAATPVLRSRGAASEELPEAARRALARSGEFLATLGISRGDGANQSS